MKGGKGVTLAFWRTVTYASTFLQCIISGGCAHTVAAVHTTNARIGVIQRRHVVVRRHDVTGHGHLKPHAMNRFAEDCKLSGGATQRTFTGRESYTSGGW